MPNYDPDKEQPVEKKAEQTLAEKVEVLQQHAKKMGVVSDGSDDKAFMDEAWN